MQESHKQNSQEKQASQKGIDSNEFNILVAKCGKSIGLKGEIKLIIYSDFSEIFTKGNVFLAKPQNSNPYSQNHTQSPNPQNLPCLNHTSQNLTSPLIKSLQKRDFHASQSLNFFQNQSDFKHSHNQSNPQSSETFLTLESFNPHKQSAFFSEIDSIDCARNLTSSLLYSSAFLSRKYCHLGENEYFWFEIIGRSIVESGEVIGVVSEIERIGSIDYLLIAVDCAMFAKYPHIKAKRFYIPYIPRYILSVEKGVIYTKDALSILEAS